MADLDKDIEIVHLKFPDNIRTRPGMFIGSTENPDIILREVVDNAIDEMLGCSTATCINIDTKSYGKWNVVSDDGRGMPILWDEEEGMTKAQMAVSYVNAGSKFNKEGMVAVGLNGVGVKASNALSNRFVLLSKITTQNSDKSIPEVRGAMFLSDSPFQFYYLEYEKGVKISEGRIGHHQAQERWGFEFLGKMSTIVAFQPDESIFDSTKCSFPKKNLVYLKVILEKFYKRSINIKLNGEEVENDFRPYKFEFLTEASSSSGSQVKFYITFDVDTNMSFNEYTGSVNSLVVDRGIHIDMIRNCYAASLRKKYDISHNYVLCGLKMTCILIAGEVDFSSQTKERLVKLSGLRYDDLEPIKSEFIRVFKQNNEYFEKHKERLDAYAESLTQISTINKIKSTISLSDEKGDRFKSKIPKNVMDASSNDRSQCELLVVEGRSAGSQLRLSRDSKTQALFFLRGKPLNAINADLDTLFANEEMKSIITAIGCGVNEVHSLKNPRYGKIILCTDADPDGRNIASLMLGMFAKKMSFLINHGMVYVLLSPLYKQNGKYFYLGEDLSDLDRTKSFNRYKGLGEMSIEETKDCITNKNTRRLLQITNDNVEYALSLLTNTGARKSLMVEKGILIDKYKTGEI